jgi:site-specific recombinase XerD
MNFPTFCEQIEPFVKSLEEKMKIEKKSKNTISSYMRTYKYFLKFCSEYHKKLTFSNLKEEDIYAFIGYKSQNMEKHTEISVASTNAIISHLKRLFEHIERNAEENYDFKKVFQDIKIHASKSEPKGLSSEEVTAVIKHLNQMKINGSFLAIRNVLLFKFLLFGGLRASEAVSVCLANIVLNDEMDLYKLTFKGKGDKIRFTYISRDIIEEEVNILKNDMNMSLNFPIAQTGTGGQMDRIQLSKMVNRIYKNCGLNVTGVHILRHTAAKRLIAAGVSIVVVQSILGHSSIQTTSIYANPSENIIKNELKDKI